MPKEHVLLLQAIRTLELDVPVMSYRINGDHIELYCYGGQVYIWNYVTKKKVTATAAAFKPQGRHVSPRRQVISMPTPPQKNSKRDQ